MSEIPINIVSYTKEIKKKRCGVHQSVLKRYLLGLSKTFHLQMCRMEAREMAQQVRTCLFLQRIQVCFSELMRSGSKVPMSPVAGQDCVNSWHIDGGKEGAPGTVS